MTTFETVLSSLGEKIQNLENEIRYKDYQLQELKKENAELQEQLIKANAPAKTAKN